MKKIQGVLGLLFVVGLVVARSWQEGEHADEIFSQLKEACNGSTKCISVLDQYGKECVDENLISHKKGKYSQDHTLDENGFKYCIKRKIVGFSPDQQVTEASETESDYIDNGKYTTVNTGYREVKILKEETNTNSMQKYELQQYVEK